MKDMDKIMGFMRSGDLAGATDAIQRALGGGSAAPDASGMRDVTPQAKALPGTGDPQPAPASKPGKPRVRPRPVADVIGEALAGAMPGTARPGPDIPPGARWDRLSDGMPHRVFVPSAPRADAPLLVLLHGCTQGPEDFARGTGICAAAERLGAHVILPEQTRAANANACWNWFEPAHQGGGESAAIARLAAGLRDRIGATGGVYAAGLSAGGAMAALLGAKHDDVFDGVGIHSGLAPGAARDMPSAFAAMQAGGAGTMPLRVPAIVFHGDADHTVAPVNAQRIAGSGGTVETRQVGGRTVRITTRGGPPALEWWQVAGLGHAWSGGDPTGSFADAAGPDATAEMIRFFQAHPPKR